MTTIRLRRNEKIDVAEYPDGFLDEMHQNLDAIRDNPDRVLRFNERCERFFAKPAVGAVTTILAAVLIGLGLYNYGGH